MLIFLTHPEALLVNWISHCKELFQESYFCMVNDFYLLNSWVIFNGPLFDFVSWIFAYIKFLFFKWTETIQDFLKKSWCKSYEKILSITCHLTLDLKHFTVIKTFTDYSQIKKNKFSELKIVIFLNKVI